MTRVWLTQWEWACCGDAFTVGDEVDFGVETRAASPFLAEVLGAELVATVDAVESHHEQEFGDRVRGRVLAVHAVTREVVERASLRRPGHGAPPDAVMPPEGGVWAMAGRDLGNGMFVGSRPSRYVIEREPVPNTAVLVPVDGVPPPPRDVDEQPSAVPEPADPPLERRRRSSAGWLVDVEEG